MVFTIALIAIAAFIAGSVIGIFAILVAGIRSDERAKNLTSGPRTGTDAVIRRLLGVGVRRAQADHGKTASCDQLMPPAPDRPDSSPKAI
jgi:hypothetical protein